MQLKIEDISMQYNDAGRVIHVLSHLNLNVESGSSLAIVGKSGVGKTSLLYILGALQRPTSGDVLIAGESLEKLWQAPDALAGFRGQKIGFIFQFHQLFAEFDAVENVAIPLIIQGMSWSKARERAKELLVRMGLQDRLTHRPSMLSGGEQQRVAISRALVAKPGILLADEPTGNLDLQTAAEINQLILDVQREERCTLIVVTHSMDVARSMQRVVELTQAGIVERTS